MQQSEEKQNKGRTLFAAVLLLLLCATLLVAGTYALWSNNTSISNHLQAGTLKVRLDRTSLTKTYPDDDGYLTTATDNTEVALSGEDATDNVFGLTGEEKLVPGSTYEATLKLTNNGDVAFTYDVIIALTSESNALAEQMHVYVDGEDKGMLSSYATASGTAIIASQTMTKTGSQTFVVKIVFDDLEENNDAQSREAAFDLTVKAVQLTKQP